MRKRDLIKKILEGVVLFHNYGGTKKHINSSLADEYDNPGNAYEHSSTRSALYKLGVNMPSPATRSHSRAIMYLRILRRPS